MSDAAQAPTSDDAALDAAIASHDAMRIAYEYRRRALRRAMYGICFVILVFGGSALIITGLTSDDLARRIAANNSVIVGFMMTLAGIVMTAFGAGAYEGASMGGFGGFNSFSSSSNLLGPLRRSSRAD